MEINKQKELKQLENKFNMVGQKGMNKTEWKRYSKLKGEKRYEKKDKNIKTTNQKLHVTNNHKHNIINNSILKIIGLLIFIGFFWLIIYLGILGGGSEPPQDSPDSYKYGPMYSY
jgi:ATP-dependent Zn protease